MRFEQSTKLRLGGYYYSFIFVPDIPRLSHKEHAFFTAAQAWCLNEFGLGEHHYYYELNSVADSGDARWNMDFSGNFYFRQIDDALAFKIRWG